VQKIVTNLVLNALDVVGPDGEIRVSTVAREGWAVLIVSDNGPGMTEEFMRESLFRPFQTTKKNGMGIGLFHTKAIVEAHGGRIDAWSELGSGTRFEVMFPAGEAPSPSPIGVRAEGLKQEEGKVA
jgi:signal transduction histidine kinase